MESAFSKSLTIAIPTAGGYRLRQNSIRNPKNWLAMLYLASNYSCMNARDVIYSLIGAVKFSDGAGATRSRL